MASEPRPRTRPYKSSRRLLCFPYMPTWPRRAIITGVALWSSGRQLWQQPFVGGLRVIPVYSSFLP
eukprot:scaffold256298_cov28-Tisochrysis_lutea.AAC.3